MIEHCLLKEIESFSIPTYFVLYCNFFSIENNISYRIIGQYPQVIYPLFQY